MYSAEFDFDFDCKSQFGGFCVWSAVLKSKSFDGGKIANAQFCRTYDFQKRIFYNQVRRHA